MRWQSLSTDVLDALWGLPFLLLWFFLYRWSPDPP
jgi:hypothetical protein